MKGIDNGIFIHGRNLSNIDEICVISSSSLIDNCKVASHIETNIPGVRPESGVTKFKIGLKRLQADSIFLIKYTLL
jgi:hypothetical protein